MNVSIEKSVDAAIEEASKLLHLFLGPACEEAGLMLAEHVRLFRLGRQTKLLRDATKILADAGLKPTAVKLKVLFPLLEAAALEDNEEMSERWASLLASAADPNNQAAIETPLIEILKQLIPTHAFVLDVFYEQVERDKLPPERWNEGGYLLSVLESYLQKDVPHFDVAIQNLLRLHLLAYPTVKLGVANGNEVRILVTSSNILCPTSLGQAFVSACKRGRTPRNHSYGVPSDSISNVYGTEKGSIRIWTKQEEASWPHPIGPFKM